MKKASVILFLCAFYLASALGQGNLNTTRIGVWPYGWGNTVACYDEYVFLSYGRVIQVYDYANPQQPQLKGEVFMDDRIGALTFHNGMAIAAGLSRFFILDVANPEQPIIISSLDISSMAYAVSVSDNFAYLALYEGEIMIIDISDVQNPVTVADIDMEHLTNDIVMMDDLAWIASGSSGIMAYDLSDPTTPTVVYQYPASGDMRSLAFENDLLFAFNKDLGLMIFDITNLPTFNLLSTTYIYGNGTNISIENDVVAVTLNITGFAVYDISNPSAPDSLGMFYADWPNRQVVLKDGYAFHCNRSAFNIFDLNTPDEMTLLASIGLSGDSRYANYWDNHIYTSSPLSDIITLDVTNPQNVVKVSEIETYEGSDIVHVKDNLLFRAGWYNKIMVYDITEPSNPVFLDSILTASSADAILKHNNLLFVSNYNSLEVFDIMDIHAPINLGVYPYGGINDMIAYGDLLYCVNFSAFFILDISDASNISQLSNTQNFLSTSLAVKDTLAYVVSSWSSNVSDKSLNVFNVKDPVSVFRVKSTEPGRNFQKVEVEDDYLYIHEANIGLQIYNIQELTPVFCGFYGNRLYEIEMPVVNGIIYLPLTAGVDIVRNDLITSAENIFIGRDERLNLFPNPADNNITIDWVPDNQTGIFTWEIIQMNGTATKSGTLMPGQRQISLDGLPSGVYVLKILLAGEKYKSGLFVRK